MLKIINHILCLLMLLGANYSYAKHSNINSYSSLDITQSPKYASLIVNSRTGEVLHKHNADLKRHPASLTKMMTIYLSFQAIRNKRLSLNSNITVSKWASSQIPTKLWLKPGQKITVRDALYGMIIHSANDASVALAEAISGSEEAFAYKMTQTAHLLGMKNTVFKNAHGLHHPHQVTTALDMAKLGIALRRDFPEYYHMFSKKSFVFRGAVINGHNRVLNRYRWADGLKTGYTAVSGSNLVTTASRPEGKIIAVVLGGPSAIARDNHMITLLDKGFDKLSNGKHVRYSPHNSDLVKFNESDVEVASIPISTAETDESLNSLDIAKANEIEHSQPDNAFKALDEQISVATVSEDLNTTQIINVAKAKEITAPLQTIKVKQYSKPKLSNTAKVRAFNSSSIKRNHQLAHSKNSVKNKRHKTFKPVKKQLSKINKN